MQIIRDETKGLSLEASVLLLALSGSGAGKELVEHGYIEVIKTDFKMPEAPADASFFVPPSLADVIKYGEHMGYNFPVEKFYYYQTKKGWKLKNGQQIVDWRAALDEWAMHERIPENTVEKLKEVWQTG